jgi:Ca2+/Na+ antiporter
MFFVAIILILTAIFYKTKKSLDRIEGVFLILTYLAFLYVTLVMQIKII